MCRTFVLTPLHSAQTLVCKNRDVQANREDVLTTGGSTILACFISHSVGPFAAKSLEICSHACKVASSMQPMLEAGIVMACIRYMHYLDSMGRVQWLEQGRDHLPNRRDMSTHAYNLTQIPKRQWFDCLLIVTRLATHAAGAYRARGAYDKAVGQNSNLDVEAFSYRQLLQDLGSSFSTQTIYDVLGALPSLR